MVYRVRGILPVLFPAPTSGSSQPFITVAPGDLMLLLASLVTLTENTCSVDTDNGIGLARLLIC